MFNNLSKSQIKNFLNTTNGNIIGGLLAAIIALPQALAFGVATDLGASAGLWCAIILSLFVGLFGCKFPLISGPTGPVSIIVASVVAMYFEKTELIFAILFLAGLFQIIIALTKASEIAKFVPYPVISGFMNGVGVILLILQIAPVLGYKMYSSPVLTLQNLPNMCSNISQESLVLALFALAVIFFTPSIIKRILPIQLVALILSTWISCILGLDVQRIGTIQMELPKFAIPVISLIDFIKITPSAIIIAIICTTETLLTTLVMDSLTKEKHNHKKTLLAHGAGNMLCACAGALVGAGATMRSVASIHAGAKSRFATIVHALVLLLVVFFFAKYVELIPLCVLASILIKIGYDIIDTKLLKIIKYAPKDDLFVMFLVFFLTVFYDLIFAIGAGIVLATLLYAKRVALQTNVEIKEVYDNEIMRMEQKLEKDFKHKIRVVHVDGQFFFGSTTQVISRFDDILGTKYLILNYESTSNLDISAIFALEDIIVRLKAQKIKLFMVIKNELIYTQLYDLGIITQLGENHIFYNEINAIEYAKTCLKRASLIKNAKKK